MPPPGSKPLAGFHADKQRSRFWTCCLTVQVLLNISFWHVDCCLEIAEHGFGALPSINIYCLKFKLHINYGFVQAFNKADGCLFAENFTEKKLEH